MNFASLFSLTAPDLIIILLIVSLLFGANKLPNFARGLGEAIRRLMEARRQWMESETESEENQESLMVLLNRLLILAAIVVFFLACGIWVFGQRD